MTFKPKRTRAPAAEIAKAVQSVAVPAKPVEATPAPIAPATPATPAPATPATPRTQGTLKMTTLNFRLSDDLARIIDKEARKVGTVRAYIARLVQKEGHDVPDEDTTPNVMKRKYDNE